jgi:phosphoglycerate dehydrogenase-like enzyme
MTRPCVLVQAWLPEGKFEQMASAFPQFAWLDGRTAEGLNANVKAANIIYGLPPIPRLAEAAGLQWIQLISAGVPGELCDLAKARGITVTNLAGLYGPSIGEHAFGLMILLARNFHLALRNQHQSQWDRGLANGLSDLRGKTLGILGLGDIGRAVARLGRAHGMRVVGCRRRDLPAPEVDQIYPLKDLHAMLAETDYLVVAVPQTARTEGMLGPAEFTAMKTGMVYVNVSRGGIAREDALLDALRSGRVAKAGLDVFAVEPLPVGHPLWTMPQVAIIPHIAGEAINQSAHPARRFARNLAGWQAGSPMEGVVNLEWGY